MIRIKSALAPLALLLPMQAHAEEQLCREWSKDGTWDTQLASLYVAGLRDGFVVALANSPEEDRAWSDAIADWVGRHHAEFFKFSMRDKCNDGPPDMNLWSAFQEAVMDGIKIISSDVDDDIDRDATRDLTL